MNADINKISNLKNDYSSILELKNSSKYIQNIFLSSDNKSININIKIPYESVNFSILETLKELLREINGSYVNSNIISLSTQNNSPYSLDVLGSCSNPSYSLNRNTAIFNFQNQLLVQPNCQISTKLTQNNSATPNLNNSIISVNDDCSNIQPFLYTAPNKDFLLPIYKESHPQPNTEQKIADPGVNRLQIEAMSSNQNLFSYNFNNPNNINIINYSNIANNVNNGININRNLNQNVIFNPATLDIQTNFPFPHYPANFIPGFTCSTEKFVNNVENTPSVFENPNNTNKGKKNESINQYNRKKIFKNDEGVSKVDSKEIKEIFKIEKELKINEIFPKFKKVEITKMILDFACYIIYNLKPSANDSQSYNVYKNSICAAINNNNISLTKLDIISFSEFCYRLSIYKLSKAVQTISYKILEPVMYFPNMPPDWLTKRVAEECAKTLESYNLYTNEFVYEASSDIPRELKISVAFSYINGERRTSQSLISGVRLFSVVYKSAIKPKDIIKSSIHLFKKVIDYWVQCHEKGGNNHALFTEEEKNVLVSALDILNGLAC